MREERKPNELLRYERRKKGWSQNKLAQLIGADSTMISRWETGERRPDHEYQETLCNLFKKDAVELGFIKKLDSAEPSTEALESGETTHIPFQEGTSQILVSNSISHIIALPPHDRTQVIQVSIPGTSPVTIQVYPYLSGDTETDSTKSGIIGERQPASPSYAQAESDNEMDRRQILKAMTAGATFLITQEFFNTETWDRLSKSLTKKPSNVDYALVEGLKNTIDSYWALRLLGSISFLELLNSVTGHLQIILRLLQNPHPLAISIGLYSAASEAAQLAGVLMFDMGHYNSAKSSYQFSLDIAREANDSSLSAAALGRISIISATQNNPAEALLFLEEAQHLAKQCNAFTLLSWLTAEKAEAYAQLQKQKACFLALEQGKNVADQIQAEEDTYGVGFNHSRLLAYEGACYMRLRQPENALQTLLYGLNSPESPEVFKRLILTDIAEASIQAGEIEQACSYLCQSLELIEQLASKRSLKDILRLRQDLQPWSNTQVVKDLDNRLKNAA